MESCALFHRPGAHCSSMRSLRAVNTSCSVFRAVGVFTVAAVCTTGAVVFTGSDVFTGTAVCTGTGVFTVAGVFTRAAGGAFFFGFLATNDSSFPKAPLMVLRPAEKRSVVFMRFSWTAPSRRRDARGDRRPDH